MAVVVGLGRGSRGATYVVPRVYRRRGYRFDWGAAEQVGGVTSVTDAVPLAHGVYLCLRCYATRPSVQFEAPLLGRMVQVERSDGRGSRL